jgi:hypothetical protein
VLNGFPFRLSYVRSCIDSISVTALFLAADGDGANQFFIFAIFIFYGGAVTTNSARATSIHYARIHML